MIWLEAKTEAQSVYIPRAEDSTPLWLGLDLYHIPTNENYEATINSFVVEGGYLNVNLSLPAGMPAGEYIYSCYWGGDAISTGVAVLVEIPEGHIVPDSGIETIEFALYGEQEGE